MITSLAEVEAARGRSVRSSLVTNVPQLLTYAHSIGGFSPTSQFRRQDPCCEGSSGRDSTWVYTSCNLVENLGWQVTKFLSVFLNIKFRVLLFAEPNICHKKISVKSLKSNWNKTHRNPLKLKIEKKFKRKHILKLENVIYINCGLKYQQSKKTNHRLTFRQFAGSRALYCRQFFEIFNIVGWKDHSESEQLSKMCYCAAHDKKNNKSKSSHKKSAAQMRKKFRFVKNKDLTNKK